MSVLFIFLSLCWQSIDHHAVRCDRVMTVHDLYCDPLFLWPVLHGIRVHERWIPHPPHAPLPLNRNPVMTFHEINCDPFIYVTLWPSRPGFSIIHGFLSQIDRSVLFVCVQVMTDDLYCDPLFSWPIYQSGRAHIYFCDPLTIAIGSFKGLLHICHLSIIVFFCVCVQLMTVYDLNCDPLLFVTHSSRMSGSWTVTSSPPFPRHSHNRDPLMTFHIIGCDPSMTLFLIIATHKWP